MQHKEKNQLRTSSSVSLIWKNRRLATYASLKTIFEILLWCKITIWEAPDSASLTPSLWCYHHLPYSPPYRLLLLFTGGPQTVAYSPYWKGDELVLDTYQQLSLSSWLKEEGKKKSVWKDKEAFVHSAWGIGSESHVCLLVETWQTPSPCKGTGWAITLTPAKNAMLCHFPIVDVFMCLRLFCSPSAVCIRTPPMDIWALTRNRVFWAQTQNCAHISQFYQWW